jgi:hypothetical protein
MTDVGLVQATPLREDLPATLRQLDDMLPYDGGTVNSLAKRMTDWHCDLVICDIAPLGIVVGREAGIPSLLIENFTWDWIYGEYVEVVPEIVPHMTYLEALFDASDYHIRAQPVCGSSECDLTVNPICRKARLSPGQVREVLGIPRFNKLVLVSLGGTSADWYPQGELIGCTDVTYLVPTAGDTVEVVDNVVMVPALSDLYHPDLVGAADVVIAKIGYSTVAEAFGAGVPLGYIPRPLFRESPVLERFIRERMNALAIGVEAFGRSGWASQLTKLLNFPRTDTGAGDGAREVAEFVYGSIFQIQSPSLPLNSIG